MANGVDISDDFLTYSSDRTDLDMYYEKVNCLQSLVALSNQTTHQIV